jgi:hypothetical protein
VKICIVGDSHCRALALALAAPRDEGAWSEDVEITAGRILASPKTLLPFFEVAPDGGVGFLSPDAVEAFEAVTGKSRIAAGDETIYAFSLGYTTTVRLGSSEWADYAPWFESDGRQRLSDGVLRDIFLADQVETLGFYRAVRALGLRCLAVESPPPLVGDRWFSPHLSPAAILHIDALGRAAIDAALAAIGVPVVRNPPGTRLADGFRDPQYPSYKAKRGDRVHADASFGRLMIPRIVTAARALIAA